MAAQQRVSLRVLGIAAEGHGADSHPSVKMGEATVIAAIGAQARVISKVKIVKPDALPDSIPTAGTLVNFDRVQTSDNLSITAGALGATSVALSSLGLDEADIQDHTLVNSGTLGGDVKFTIRLLLIRTAMPSKVLGSASATGASSRNLAPASTSVTGAASKSSGVVPTLSTTSAAAGGAATATRAPFQRTASQQSTEPHAPAIETVVIRAPAPQPQASKHTPEPLEISTPNTAEADGSVASKVTVLKEPAFSEKPPQQQQQQQQQAPTPPKAEPATKASQPVSAADAVPPASVPQATPPASAAKMTSPKVEATAPDAIVPITTMDAVKEPPPSIGGGTTPLHCRLVDYFAVMVSAEVEPSHEQEAQTAAEMDSAHPDDSSEEDGYSSSASGERPRRSALRNHHQGFQRRLGKIQYRYPKTDHADIALPENVDWFIFPNGIAPIVQPTYAQSRPPTRRSVFVLSNVANDAKSGKMYGCCLTAYRKEVDEDVDEDADSSTLWWPVVLFLLSRYPVVPQLQVILERVYNVYDAGISTGAAASDTPPPSYCNLQEYLRMLVFETPVPIRRANLAVQVFLPGPEPRADEDSTCALFLPAPDALPTVEFDARHVLRTFRPSQFLRVLAALVLEKRIVVVAKTVQQLVETCESFMTLMYPLQWDMPYIPVLPAHLAIDCLGSPVPFVYGLLSSYASRVLSEITEPDASELVVVDATAGHVDVGVRPYLERRAARSAGKEAPDAARDDAAVSLKFPEPLMTECAGELTDLGKSVRPSHHGSSKASPSSASYREFNEQIQSLFCRFFAVLLYGYRSATFFPGLPTQFQPQLSADVYLDSKASQVNAAVALFKVNNRSLAAGLDMSASHTKEFLKGMAESQSLSRLLQRHTSIYLRPFHSLTSMLSTQSPTLAETRKWAPPRGGAVYTLVVPPPGYASLVQWQISAGGTRLLPAPGVTSHPPPKPKKKRGEKRPDDRELARVWPSGEVAAAVGMTTWEAQELEILAGAAAKGNTGPRGDDIGGAAEEVDESATETAEILQAATAAAGEHANPVTGRTSVEPVALSSRREKLQMSFKKRGLRWIRGERDNDGSQGAKETGGTEEDLSDRVYKWLQKCLVTGVVPPVVHPSIGIPWDEEDALINNGFHSATVRATFVRVLQTQVLLSAGLSAPLSGATPGAKLQLQPLLGLGVSAHALTHPVVTGHSPVAGAGGPSVSSNGPAAATGTALKGLSGSSTARSLLIQYVPVVRFQRLAAACAALLSECLDDKDYNTAGALLQVSYFYYTEPNRDREGMPPGVQGSRVAWNSRRQYLHAELAAEPIWQQLPFWDSYVAQANAVEEQQIHLLHLQVVKHAAVSEKAGQTQPNAVATAPTAASSPSGVSYTFTLLQSLLSPMVQMGLDPDNVRSFISRTCVKNKVLIGEEKTILSLVDHLVLAEKSSGTNTATPQTLNTYTVFRKGAPVTDRSSSGASRERRGSITGAIAGITRATPPATETRPGPPPTPPSSYPAVSSAGTPSAAAAAAAAAKEVPSPTPVPPAAEKKPKEAQHQSKPSIPDAGTSVPAPMAAAVPLTHETAPEPASAPTTPVPAEPVPEPASATAAAAPEPPPEPQQEHPPMVLVAPTQPHPWSQLLPKDAENAARDLVAVRRYPPRPDTSLFHRAKSKRDLKKDAKPASLDTQTAQSSTPQARAPSAYPVTPPKGAGRRMPIVKAFGTGVGLSVAASSFSAAVPAEHVVHVDEEAEPDDMPPTGEELGLLDAALNQLAKGYGIQRAGPNLPSPLRGSGTAITISCLSFRGHAPGAAITAMSHDPIDHRVVTGGNDGRVVLWDMRDRTYVYAYEEHTAAITAVKLAGDCVFSASQDGTVRISSFARSVGWALFLRGVVAVMRRMFSLQALTAQLTASRLAASATSGAQSVDEEDEGEDEGEVEDNGAPDSEPPLPSGESAPSTADYLEREPPTTGNPSKHGGGFYVPFPFPVPTMFGSTSRAGSKFMSAVKLKGHSGPVTAVDAWERPEQEKRGWFGRKKKGASGTVSSNSTYVVVSGGSDGSIRTWVARWRVKKSGSARGQALHISTHTNLHKSNSIIEQVKLSADGRLCVSAGRDGRIGVVDVATGKTWVMMMPSTSRGLFGWNASPAATTDPIIAPTGLPTVSCSVDVSSRPVTVTSAGADGTVRVWDLRTGSIAVAFPSGSPVWAFDTVPAWGAGLPRFSESGQIRVLPAPLGDHFLMSGHEDGLVRKWDSRSPHLPMGAWTGHTAPIVALTAEGDKLVTGDTRGSVRLWDAQTGISVRCDGHASHISAVAMTDDYFCSASYGGDLRTWFPNV